MAKSLRVRPIYIVIIPLYCEKELSINSTILGTKQICIHYLLVCWHCLENSVCQLPSEIQWLPIPHSLAQFHRSKRWTCYLYQIVTTKLIRRWPFINFWRKIDQNIGHTPFEKRIVLIRIGFWPKFDQKAYSLWFL